MAPRIAEARAAAVAALGERLADAPEGPFARAALALEGGEAGDLAACARRATPPPAAPFPGRTAPTSPSPMSARPSPPPVLDRRAEGAADRPDPRSCRPRRRRATGRRPILLLDEIAAHLDPARRAALFERLGAAGGQVWMTGTEPALFAEIAGGSSRFEVENGTVRGR